MAGERVLVVDDSVEIQEVIRNLILEPAGYRMLGASNGTDGLRMALEESPDLILLDEQMPGMSGVQVLTALRERDVQIPVIFMTFHGSEELATQVLRLGAYDYVIKPFEPMEMTEAVQRGLALVQKRAGGQQALKQHEEANQRLQQQIQELTTLHTIGRSVTSLLDLETILTRVVEAATYLVRADEGLVLLPEPETGDLVLRAAKNVDRKQGRELRIRVQDSMASQVLNSGEPLLVVSGGAKVATGYLVQSLIYVPLRTPAGNVLGILGVTNREGGQQTFTNHHVRLLTILADYAVVAIENANACQQVRVEQQAMEAVLREMESPVIIVNSELRVIFCNPAAMIALGLLTSIVGQVATETLTHPALQELLTGAADAEQTLFAEVSTRSNRVYNAQLTPVEDVGYVLMLQDITNLKELDRVKSEFVSTISHDLRTPLTAIQGYVDLLEKAGPLNDQQRNFVAGALRSIVHITALINDLSELSRIEAGYDLQMQPLQIEQLIEVVLDEFMPLLREKQLEMRWKRTTLPPIRGNARRLRQVMENLLSNAVKYTPEGGWVAVEALEDNGHIVVRVADSGVGIPPEDQPHVFERFYRAQTPETFEVAGTGLGLAIVKSVVEKHGGRIWMESQPYVGSVFTFVLHAMKP